MAAVKVVLPSSTCPIVPMFTCGLLRSNFSLLIVLFESPQFRSMRPGVRQDFDFLEPAMRFELMTSSLPRRRSTPELRGLSRNPLHCAIVQVSRRKSRVIGFTLLCWSGRRDSNSRPSAWKADALPTELHPPLFSRRSEISNLRSQLVQGVGFEPT